MKNIILFLIFLIQLSLNAQWMKVEDIPNVDILSLFVDGENIYAGADTVIYLSTNSGSTWKPSSKITDSLSAVSALYKYNSTIFAGTYVYGVFISNDEGKSWQALNNGLTGLGSKYISDFEVRGDSIFAATIGASVFLMNLNEMTSWKPYKTNIPVSVSGNTEDIYNYNDTLIAAAGGNGYLYFNDYSSASWEEIKFGEMTGEPNAICKLSSVNNIIVGGSTYGVYYSTDSGKRWEFIPSEIGFINDVSIIKNDSKLYLYLTKISGSYLYEFSQVDKTLIPLESLHGVSVADAVIIDNKLFTGRISTGLWYKELTPNSVDDKNIIKSFNISQNFPNPFNPSTTIKFYIPVDATVKVVIYDLLGREIGKIVDDFKSAGEHEVNFNANNLSSGTYFYKVSVIKDGSVLHSQTKQMLLLK